MKLYQSVVVLISTLFLIIIPVNGDSRANPLNDMKVHFINVGQGDSMLLQTPNGKNILIDGGPPDSGKQVVRYLNEHNVSKLDLIIATHPDFDHIGGLPQIMKQIKVERVIDSGKIHTTRTYTRYLNQIRKQEIPFQIAKENKKINIDPNLDILVLNAHEKSKNNNESSIVLKITYQEIDFLLMGDVEREQEREFLEKYDIKAEILKVGHHGSNTSSTLRFLETVRPKVAILTYSKQNNYGHPVNRVIANLHRIQSQIYSTAAYGNIVIETEGKNFYLFPEKNPMQGLDEKAG